MLVVHDKLFFLFAADDIHAGPYPKEVFEGQTPSIFSGKVLRINFLVAVLETLLYTA